MSNRYAYGVVSIGLPVHNGGSANKLPRALDSLLAQTYSNIEVIISDNASTDDTEKICRAYAARDNRIRYVRQKEDIGLISNTQFVMEEARGEYFMLAADDDWWDREFIRKPKEVLDVQSMYGVALSAIRIVYPSGAIVSEIRFAGTPQDPTHKDFGEVFDMMSRRSKLIFFSGLYRTKLLHDLLQQPFPKCIRYERVFLSELAFATHIYSLSDVLYHKTIYTTPPDVRYTVMGLWAAHKDPLAYTKHIVAVVARLLHSRVIPFQRKVALYPIHILRCVWYWRRVLLKEWMLGVYTVAQRMYALIRRVWRP